MHCLLFLPDCLYRGHRGSGVVPEVLNVAEVLVDPFVRVDRFEITLADGNQPRNRDRKRRYSRRPYRAGITRGARPRRDPE